MSAFEMCDGLSRTAVHYCRSPIQYSRGKETKNERQLSTSPWVLTLTLP